MNYFLQKVKEQLPTQDNGTNQQATAQTRAI